MLYKDDCYTPFLNLRLHLSYRKPESEEQLLVFAMRHTLTACFLAYALGSAYAGPIAAVPADPHNVRLQL